MLSPTYRRKFLQLCLANQINSSLLPTGIPSLVFPPSWLGLFHSPSSFFYFMNVLQIHCQFGQTACNLKRVPHSLVKQHSSRERSGVHHCPKPMCVHCQEQLCWTWYSLRSRCLCEKSRRQPKNTPCRESDTESTNSPRKKIRLWVSVGWTSLWAGSRNLHPIAWFEFSETGVLIFSVNKQEVWKIPDSITFP